MTVVTILPDGRIIARTALATQNIATGAGAQSVTVADLRKVEYVLQLNIDSALKTTYAVLTGHGITNNAVGLSFVVGAGTTITGEIITIGF